MPNYAKRLLDLIYKIKLYLKGGEAFKLKASPPFRYMFVLRSNRISWKSGALIVRYIARKMNEFSFVLYCSENFSMAHNFRTTDLIQVKFSANCTSPNEHFNQAEN